MSWYITLRADAQYTGFVAAEDLCGFLAAQPELQQMGPQEFVNANACPPLRVVMASCQADGGYSIAPKQVFAQVNVVELLCTYSAPPEWYEALATRIAVFLGWQAFEDSEGRQIWPRLAHE